MSARLPLAAGVLLLCGAEAYGAASDSLVMSAQSITFSGPTGGGAAENLDWIHRPSDNGFLSLGVGHEEFSGARLDRARVGGAFKLGTESLLAGQVEAGPAVEGAANSTFARVRVDVARTISPRLQLSGGSQYVEANGGRTVLLDVEMLWLSAARLSLRAQVGQSVAGDLPTRYATFRIDSLRRVQVFTGISVGTGARSVVELQSNRNDRFTDAFAGLTVPISRCTLGVAWDWLALSTVIRRTATLSLTVPLKRGA